MATRFCFSRLTKCFYFLLFILLIWSCGTSNSNPSSTSSPLKVIAYYAGGADRIDDFNLEGVDQLIYSFLHLKGNRLALDNAADSLTLLKLTGLKAHYPQLKVLVSLGGWGGCKTCSDVFNTPEGREEFAQSTAEILAHYKADGIDLDWEYPVVPGPPGHPYRPEDKENFTLLSQELRKAMPKEAILSFAAGGYPSYLEQAIDWAAVMPLMDHVNVMSYDMVGGYSKKTGHHTPLYSTPQQERSANQAVQYLIAQGVPAQKIVIGAAFYGRIYEKVAPQNNGLYQAGQFKRGVNQVLFDSLTQNFSFHWDDSAQAPYAYNAQDSLFLTYDNARSIALKTNYAKNQGLGGIMFWQLMNDKPQNGLLKVMVETAKK
jgi:chitinase